LQPERRSTIADQAARSAGQACHPVRWTPQPVPLDSRDPATAQPIAPIILRLPTAADPATLWAALTVPERIASWFTTASPLGAVGAPYRLDFGDGSMVDGELLELEPGRRFAHTWHWLGAPASETTQVTWEVEPTPDGRSAVVLRHAGWAEAGLGDAARDDHRDAWREYLEGLRELLSGGA